MIGERAVPFKVEDLDLKKFYINGQWVKAKSTRLFPVNNPATEETVGEIVMGSVDDVNDAVLAATDALKTYSYFSKEERLGLLKKLLTLTKQRQGDLAWAMTIEMGAPITMSREAQAETGIGHLESFIRALESFVEKETLESGDVVVKEAIGVCGLITPWNWPVNQIALKVIPALATGCTCILKPSEYTPISAFIYAELIHEAGFPPGAFNLIHGEGDVVGAALSRHPDIQMISFTGSTRAGKAITKAASETIKRVTLELGGKSPNILFESCDLKKSVTHAVDGCFYNTGQSCDAPTRLIVQRSIYDDVLQLAKLRSEEIMLGDPTEEGSHLGPLFDQIQFDRVQRMIQVGLDDGAQILVGGLGKPDGFEIGHYVKPTIFYNVHNQMRVAREEIFGPVLVIIPFTDEEEAVRISNDTPYGLAAYLQTKDGEQARRVARALKAGSVYINGGYFNYGSPFGGVKQSGNGREGGEYGLEDYIELKSLHGMNEF